MSVLNAILAEKNGQQSNQGLEIAKSVMSQNASDVFANHIAELNEKQATSLLQLKEKRRNTYYAGNTELAYFFADFNGMLFFKEKQNAEKGSSYEVVAYSGRRMKPDFYYRFRSLSEANSYVESWASGQYNHALEKQERKERKKELNKKAQELVSVGDIFKASWGYEQTNIDYYQVISMTGKRTVELRKIAGNMIERSYGDQGRKVPVPDEFVGEAFSRQISVSQWSKNDKVHVNVTIDSVSIASLKSKNENGDFESDYCSWGY